METISAAESDLPAARNPAEAGCCRLKRPDNVGSRYNTYFSGHLSGFARVGVRSPEIRPEVSQQYATLRSTKSARPPVRRNDPRTAKWIYLFLPRNTDSIKRYYSMALDDSDSVIRLLTLLSQYRILSDSITFEKKGASSRENFYG